MIYEFELQCHPATPCAAVDHIEVLITPLSASKLTIRYLVAGMLARLRVPALREPQRVDELWRHTCCELFIASTINTTYCEFNFSPSSEWAAYEFQSYRQGMRPLPMAPGPRIAVTTTAAELQLCVELDMSALPARWLEAELNLALSMVIEDTAGRMSYWALKHPAGKPDFHHADGFALRKRE